MSFRDVHAPVWRGEVDNRRVRWGNTSLCRVVEMPGGALYVGRVARGDDGRWTVVVTCVFGKPVSILTDGCMDASGAWASALQAIRRREKHVQEHEDEMDKLLRGDTSVEA